MPKVKRASNANTGVSSRSSACAPYSYSASSSGAGASTGSSRKTSKLLSLLDGTPYPSPQDTAPIESQKPTKQKGKRKDKDPSSSQVHVEKRAARFRPSASKDTKDRVMRIIQQSRSREGNELREVFKVLGSTGNVYTVNIDKIPSCDCPDFRKGHCCKHLLFIFIKVLHVPQNSTHWFQKALLSSELEEIFRDAPPAPTCVANQRIQDAYAQATGQPLARALNPANERRRKQPTADDNCPVCYDTMTDGTETTLIWCDECGNCLHKECFQNWAKKAPIVNCVFCRAARPTPGSRVTAAGGSSRTSEGYVNLSGIAGVSPVRDTSTYYQGPRRGQRHYGYQDYEDDFRF